MRLNFREFLGDNTGLRTTRQGYDQALNRPQGLAYHPPILPKKRTRLSKKIDDLFGKKDEAWGRQEKEQEKDWWTLLLAYAGSSSTGMHGFGGEPDIPAGDCYDDIKWELYFKKWPPQVEQLLRKANTTVWPSDSSFQSYHECQVSFNVWLHVRGEDAEIQQINKLLPPDAEFEKAGRWDHENEWGNNFPFTSYKQAILDSIKSEDAPVSPPEELESISQKPASPYAPKPGQTSSEYWKRIMQRAELAEKMKKRKDFTTREGD
jgi:hypothetical protein